MFFFVECILVVCNSYSIIAFREDWVFRIWDPDQILKLLETFNIKNIASTKKYILLLIECSEVATYQTGPHLRRLSKK